MSATGELLEAIFRETRGSDRHHDPGLPELAPRLGWTEDETIEVGKSLAVLGLIRWETTHWVTLTPLGIQGGRRLRLPR